jgi:hypothetical protein
MNAMFFSESDVTKLDTKDMVNSSHSVDSVVKVWSVYLPHSHYRETQRSHRVVHDMNGRYCMTDATITSRWLEVGR